MQAAEANDANRGFEIENAGGFRCRDFADAMAERDVGDQSLLFEGEIGGTLNCENQRLRDAGFREVSASRSAANISVFSDQPESFLKCASI